MTLGEHLAYLRTRDKLTRTEIAVCADVSQTHLTRVEADESRPSPELLSRLLTVYDVRRDEDEWTKAWLLLGRSYLPSAAKKHVDVYPANIAEQAAKVAAQWVRKFYDPMGKREQKILVEHIKQKLEQR